MSNEPQARGDLRRLQLAETEILRRFVAVCEQLDMPYYLMGGTLLGAVRHKGFIPWDDDVDVALTRPDYERFLREAGALLPPEYRLSTFENDPEHTRYLTRIEWDTVKVLETGFEQAHVNSAWIDIFPLDGMPDNALRRRFHGLHLLALRALLQFSQFDTMVNLKLKNRPWYESVLVWFGAKTHFGRHLDTKKQLRKIDRSLKKYDYARCSYLVNFMGAYKLKEMFPKSCYGNGGWYEFEGMRLHGPADYDTILTQMYGDYMAPPPEDQRNKHETKVVDENETQE